MEEVTVNHILGREFVIDRSNDALYENEQFINCNQWCKMVIKHGPFMDEWIANRGSWSKIFAHFKTFNDSSTHIMSKGCWFAAIQHCLSYNYPESFENKSSNIKQYCIAMKFRVHWVCLLSFCFIFCFVFCSKHA